MKRVLLWPVVVVICMSMIAVLSIWLSRASTPASPPSLVTLSPEDLKLTLAWSGEVIEAPAPATLPAGMTESEDYAKWLRGGEVTSLSGEDEQGNRVVASALGFAIGADGVRRPLIPAIKVFSPSGTLLNDTTYTPQGYPEMWIVYNPDGSRLAKVWYRSSGHPASPSLREVTFYIPDGTGRQYVAGNPEQIAWAEWEIDSNGSTTRLIHGGKQEMVQEFLARKRQQSPEPTASDNQPWS